MAMKLSALRAGRFHSKMIAWYPFLLENESSRGHSTAESLAKLKNAVTF
jgi:hypothetical protein